ncbi:MAG: transposase [Rectinemataceae bacterium]
MRRTGTASEAGRGGQEGQQARNPIPVLFQKLVEAEAEAKLGAGLRERTEDRTTHRNGYRDRSLQTRIGELTLKIPSLCDS